jgi:hypothetical protein
VCDLRLSAAVKAEPPSLHTSPPGFEARLAGGLTCLFTIESVAMAARANKGGRACRRCDLCSDLDKVTAEIKSIAEQLRQERPS